MKNIDKLIDLISKDIDSLNNGLNKDSNRLAYIISNLINKGRDLIEIDFFYFEELIYRHCYENIPEDYDYIKGYVPQNRLELFENIFLSDVKNIEGKDLDWIRNRSNFQSNAILYNNLFYSIYIESIITTKSISDIFKEFLNQWQKAFNKSKMPVKFEIILPNVFINNDYIMINEEFEVKTLSTYRYGEKFSTPSEMFYGSFLIYKTELSFNHNLFDDSENANRFNEKFLQQEFTEKRNSIYKIIFCLYLKGVKFVYEHYDLSYPWWIGYRRWNFKKPRKEFGEQLLSNEQIEEFLRICRLVKNLDIFGERSLLLGQHKYLHLFEKRFLSEAILDEFIILESIFTKGGKTEVTFRLSLNIALFLATSIKEFKEIYDFFRDMYGIRSLIAHGEIWTGQLKSPKKIYKKYRKYLSNKDSNIDIKELGKYLFDKIKEYIDRVFIKIIELKYSLKKENKDINILNKFEGTYFLETSDIIKKNNNKFNN